MFVCQFYFTGVCLDSEEKYLMEDSTDGPKPFTLRPLLDKEQICKCGVSFQ